MSFPVSSATQYFGDFGDFGIKTPLTVDAILKQPNDKAAYLLAYLGIEGPLKTLLRSHPELKKIICDGAVAGGQLHVPALVMSDYRPYMLTAIENNPSDHARRYARDYLGLQ